MKIKYQDMTKEQQEVHKLKYEAICPDYDININGGCLRARRVDKDGNKYCDYVQSETMVDDHFLCEVSLKEIMEKKNERTNE